MLIATLIEMAASIPMAFLNSNTSYNWLIYPLAGLQGVGIAILLNTGTALISDVIGKDNKSSAFVYGMYSFSDKVANGVLLYWLVAFYSTDGSSLRYIIAIIPF